MSGSWAGNSLDDSRVGGRRGNKEVRYIFGFATLGMLRSLISSQLLQVSEFADDMEGFEVRTTWTI